MRISTLRSAALLLAALAALGACDRLPSDPGIPLDGAAPSSSAEAPADGRREDAELYAARYGVGIDEALHRLALQGPAGELNARLLAEHPETFAGLTIEHAPAFEVVARFTRGGEQALRGAAVDPRLAGVLRADRAAVPLRALQVRLDAAYARVRGRGIEATGGLNLRENRPEIYVLAPAAAAARAALPADAGAAVLVVDQLPREEVTLYGGLPLSTCTSGFTVQNSSGAKGITTAGHCGNSQSYAGYALTFLGEAYFGSYDIQWHNRSGATYEPRIKAGSGFRSITGTRLRAYQVVGEWLCKQGKTTGWTCGTLDTKSYCWNNTCTWAHVLGGYTNLSEGGDSGGPWVNGEIAYGSHTFGGGNNSGYMPIDYLTGIGVSVVLASPPPPPPPLSVYINGPGHVSQKGTYTFEAFPSNGTGSYTYQWEFTWVNSGHTLLAGSQKTQSVVISPYDGDVIVKVTVWSGGETATATQRVYTGAIEM